MLEKKCPLDAAETAIDTDRVIEELAVLSESDDLSAGIGAFVKIIVGYVPIEAIDLLIPSSPLVIGGYSQQETKLAQIRCNIKKHRWHPRLMKSKDPLVVSLGWMRFQSIPVFSMEDRNGTRERFLKYSLQHSHCHATIFGPTVPSGSGVVFLRDFNKKSKHYRIAGTGTVTECNDHFKIVKKLKLIGEPERIEVNTAFVKNMFNSDLEVSMFVGSKIQTVSGIRGQVKKSVGKEGLFPAGFEDQIVMSDLVVLKAWVSIELPTFFNPAIDNLNWTEMRSVKELNLAINDSPDWSEGTGRTNNADGYGPKPISPEKIFLPLRLPRRVLYSLPFDARKKILAIPEKVILSNPDRDDYIHCGTDGTSRVVSRSKKSRDAEPQKIEDILKTLDQNQLTQKETEVWDMIQKLE